MAIYARRIEQLVMDGCSTGCQDAAGLVARMAALRSRGEHTAYPTALKTRHARKRNFMRLL